MIVTVSVLSGDTNAYRSVLSAVGSCEMSGASRWLDAVAACGLPPRVAATAPSAARSAASARPSASFLTDELLCRRRPGMDAGIGAVGGRAVFAAAHGPVHT